jgi:hypothetical protein
MEPGVVIAFRWRDLTPTTKSVAESSTHILMPWIKENLGPLLISFPEVIDGEVLISEMQ